MGKAGKIVRLVRVMRIMRIFKLVRHFAGLQSLIYTLNQAYKELGLLMLLVGVAVLTFASLVYFAEKDNPKGISHRKTFLPTMYRVYQPNFPTDISNFTTVNGEIWLIDPVYIFLFTVQCLCVTKQQTLSMIRFLGKKCNFSK